MKTQTRITIAVEGEDKPIEAVAQTNRNELSVSEMLKLFEEAIIEAGWVLDGTFKYERKARESTGCCGAQHQAT